MKPVNWFCLCSSGTKISTWPTLLFAQLPLLIGKTIWSFQFLFPCGKAKITHQWKHLFSPAFSAANIFSINILIVLMHHTNAVFSFLLFFMFTSYRRVKTHIRYIIWLCRTKFTFKTGYTVWENSLMYLKIFAGKKIDTIYLNLSHNYSKPNFCFLAITF